MRLSFQGLRRLLDRGISVYDTVQVELHGQYSLARIQEFAHFQAHTSLLYAVSIVLLTPLPCLVTLIALDLLPMNSAYAGVNNQTVWFWFRAAFSLSLVSMCIILQLHQSAPTLPMSRTRLLAICAFLGPTSAAIFYALGILIGFPTPFAMQIVAVPWFWMLATALMFSWVPTVRIDKKARTNLTRYLIAYSSELAIIFAYPIYYYVFSLLSGTGQAAFSLVLPVMKLFFKNWVSYGMDHMEDLAPTTIVFNIDVFHALFLSTTTQKSKSMGSTAIIMLVDAAQMVATFSDLHKVQTRYRGLCRRLEGIDANDPAADSLELTVRSKFDAIAYARHIMDADPRVREHADLALPRHLRRDPLQIQSANSVTKMRLPGIETSVQRNTSSDARVVPTKALKHEDTVVQSTIATHLEPPLTRRERTQVKSVACVLQMLHMTEFYVLIEFAEVMMSSLFAVYLAVITRLPNRVHYENLRDLSEAELRDTTSTVAIYALLELASFLVLCVGLNAKLEGFSSIRQLAFALRKHWLMAQVMLVLWVVCVMQLSLTHVGADYTFRFAWLHSNATQ